MKQYDLLIVDDEQRYADMLVRRLALRDCICKVCYNGQDAIRMVRKNKFHLIVLDLQLPDLYGTEVLVKIKEINQRVPVLILTGHGTEKDREECMSKGACAFMHKPLDIEALLSLLHQIKNADPMDTCHNE